MQQGQDKVFANGMFLKDRHPNTPDWVIATIGIKVDEFMQVMQQHKNNGWLTVVLKKSQGGKKYFEVDTWKPTQQAQPQQSPQGYAQQNPPPPAPQGGYQAPQNPTYEPAQQIPGLDNEAPF